MRKHGSLFMFACMLYQLPGQAFREGVMKMMPYDENENRFDAVRKSFQWMERSKPSVAARGDVDLPSDSRRLFETGDLPEGIAVPPHERDCGRAHPMCGTDSEDLTAWCREHET